jgi:hypothetical protein
MPDNCVICQKWQSLPYAARYSTPVEVPEVEAVLVMGFKIKEDLPVHDVGTLCERHLSMLSPPEPVGLAAQILGAQTPGPEAVPGAKVSFPCPACGKLAMTGEMHVCGS